MVKRNGKVRKASEESFHEGVYDSFQEIVPSKSNHFNIEDLFKNVAQRLAYTVYEQHDVLFLIGPAGSGKSHLACMFAINEMIRESKKRIILTRPIVGAGEDLGYLPGTFSEKTDPYMTPLYECMRKIIPNRTHLEEKIQSNTEVAPLAYLRGRTFNESVCILDEAQNCTWSQILLFLTRLGEDSKMIITCDPTQSDIGNSCIMDVVYRLENVRGVGMVRFTDEHIVRHRLVSEIIKRLQN